MLMVVLNDAIQDSVISKSPADGIKSLKDTDTKASETYRRALTEQEQKDFMQEMAQDYYYEFVSLLLCTGMRSGETAALMWDDIDYKQNVIHVTKTAAFNEDGTATIGSPKSEAGKRDIPLNDTIRDILLRQRKKQGGNPQTLKTILGHNSLAMTMDLYSHVLPNTKQKEMDSLKIVL